MLAGDAAGTNSRGELRLLFEGAALQPFAAGAATPAATSAWLNGENELCLVLNADDFESKLAQAAAWAERITLCLTAPQSQRAALRGWRELLAHSAKCDGIYLRRAEATESWLLHRLHDTGTLRLLEGGGKQVAANLLLFARGDELRALLTHIPLERAVSGAGFGALLAFRAAASGEIARASRAQAESWARLSHIPTGSEIDALALGKRRAEPTAALSVPCGPLRVVSELAELEAGLERFVAGPEQDARESGWTLSWRTQNSGLLLQLQHRDPARAPFLLTLHAGSAWASGNALLLAGSDGQLALGWRGGLLGPSRSRAELLWSEARLPSLAVEDAALGPVQRVALVAHTGAALGPQLGSFLRETARLGEAFGVEPPPALGHALADFASLSSRQQTLLLWRALLGLGALDFGVATLTAVQVLREQGYLQSAGAEPAAGVYGSVAELLAQAAESGSAFDRPGVGKIRAIQPDLAAYVMDDWLECLLQALPEQAVVPRRRALRLAFERAQRHWGLRDATLCARGAVERLLDAAVSSAVRRGLLLRVGAGGVRRLSPLAVPAAAASPAAHADSEDGLLPGWTRSLERLTPVQRLLLTRRAGRYCRRETLDSVAQRLGLSLERARQVEADAWHQVASDSAWLGTLRARLERALGAERSIAVPYLTRDDAWWQGVDQHLELAEAVFEGIGAELYRVELGPPRARTAFFARFPQAELERVLAGLLEQASQLAAPAALEEYRALAATAAEGLDRGLCEYLADVLEAKLELDPSDPARALRYATPTGPIVKQLPELTDMDSEARLRLEDAARWAFRSARTPLSLSAVSERIRQRIDVDEAALGALLCHAPFVQRNADQYGLLARDVPGGADAIALALNAVVVALDESRRVLPLRQAFALLQPELKQPSWSVELLRSLVGSDPALCLSTANDITLRRWEHTRSFASAELVCPGLPAAARSRFEKLVHSAATEPRELARRLHTELGRLERRAASDDFVAVSLACQLCLVHDRLLEHAVTQSVEVRTLAQATSLYCLAALTHDEDDPEAPAVDRDQLDDARAVLAAVLAHLELPWL